MIYEYSDTSTQGCAVTEGFGGVPGSSGGIGGGGYNNRQKRRSGSSPAAAVQDVKDFLKQNTKSSDGVAFEVKQRRQSGSNAYPTFIELALIIDKAMVGFDKQDRKNISIICCNKPTAYAL